MIRFDAYLYSEMSQKERDQFEKELEMNAALAEEFSAHKKFLDDFLEGVEYRETKKNLKSIHKSIYNPDENFFTSRKFYIPLAVAASFIFILLAVNPWINEGNTSTGTGDDKDLAYAESSDSIALYEDSYSTAVTEMLDTVSYDQTSTASGQLLNALNTNPLGTAFMISNDGYFFTSKYLVEDKNIVRLQHPESNLTFEVNVVYEDARRDFAILKCDPKIAQYFEAIPFRFITGETSLNQTVFTLGYPKKEIVYSESVISSQSGYGSDSSSFKLSMLADDGYSGAPLFSYNGDLIGMINKNNSNQQSVTYVLDHHYILHILDSLRENEIEFVNMSKNYNLRPKTHADLVKRYKQFIFEVHP